MSMFDNRWKDDYYDLLERTYEESGLSFMEFVKELFAILSIFIEWHLEDIKK